MDSTNTVWSVAVSSRAKCTLIGCAVDCTRERENERTREKEEKNERKRICVLMIIEFDNSMFIGVTKLIEQEKREMNR